MNELERYLALDWLAFTTRRPLSEVLGMFSALEHPLEVQPRGANGYHHMFRSVDGVTVMYSLDRADVHVVISGVGCSVGLDALLCYVGPDDHVTRMDIALDCYNSGWTCDEIWGHLRGGQYVAASKSIRHVSGLQKSDGYTIYIGASTSDRMVRVYDKGAQSGTDQDWMRIEVQLRRQSADSAFQRINKDASCFMQFAFGLILKQIRILSRVPTDQERIDNNVARISQHEKWAILFDHARPVRLSVPRPPSTVTSAIRYVKNCAATLKALRVMPDYSDFVHYFVDQAKLRPKHLKIQSEIMSLTAELDSYEYD